MWEFPIFINPIKNRPHMDKILRPQHWQVFIYAVILPSFFPGDDSSIYFNSVWILLFVLWKLKVDQELMYRLSGRMALNFNLMAVVEAVSVVYLMIVFFTIGGYHISTENYHEYGWEAWILIPMHMFVFFSFFYSLRFTAKAIASIESRSEAHFANYFAYLVAMFFFPIGIWWIQPKVNRILKEPIRETEVVTE
jgi:uncharacterized Tic20 family protein